MQQRNEMIERLRRLLQAEPGTVKPLQALARNLAAGALPGSKSLSLTTGIKCRETSRSVARESDGNIREPYREAYRGISRQGTTRQLHLNSRRKVA